MKRKIILTSVILILLTLFSSCDVKPMEEGRSVNEYIFPYVEFTLSEDGTYYSASILEGAAVSKIYIPAYVENNEEAKLPIKYFTGFQNDEDAVNLKSTTFESSSTEIKLDSLNQASVLSTIKYEKVEGERVLWKNLPTLESTEEKEFKGWRTTNTDAPVYNGDIMVPGYTTLYPYWGKHDNGFVYEDAKEPGCTTVGWNAYHYCKDCGYTTKVEIPALGHDIIKHKISDATCITEGYREVCWQCTRCGEYFSDEEGKNPISEERLGEIIIKSAGHTSDGITYFNDEYHYYFCTVCSEYYGYEEHNLSDWHDSSDNLHREKTCSICDYKIVKSKDHKWSRVEETESTCTVEGHKEYWECILHSGEYALSGTPTDDEILNEEALHREVDKDLKAHELSSWVTTDCKEHWKVCSECGGVFEKEEHEFRYTFTQDKERYFTVERKCAVCGATGENKSESRSPAFDISASFGKIKIVKGSGNEWTLSYYGNAEKVEWKNEQGGLIGEGAEAIVIKCKTQGEGEFKVFCYAYDNSNKLKEIAFALLTTY